MTRKTELHSRNHIWRGKAIITTHYASVYLASFITRIKRMRHIILSSVSCRSVPYFPTPHTQHQIRKNNKQFIAHKKCVCNFSITFCLKHFSF